MKNKLRQVTISITPGMKEELDWIKKEYYQDLTDNEMIKKLICIGLNTSYKNRCEDCLNK